MAKVGKTIGKGLGLMFIGYAVGILTAPRSGKQTRRKIEQKATNSVRDIEKELKIVYKDTKDYLDKLAKDNPTLTNKVKDAKSKAQKSQIKVKELLSAIHGQDNVDEDLDSALKSAKVALSDLKRYISK